jgi:hypothetical protein
LHGVALAGIAFSLFSVYLFTSKPTRDNFISLLYSLFLLLLFLLLLLLIYILPSSLPCSSTSSLPPLLLPLLDQIGENIVNDLLLLLLLQEAVVVAQKRGGFVGVDLSEEGGREGGRVRPVVVWFVCS